MLSRLSRPQLAVIAALAGAVAVGFAASLMAVFMLAAGWYDVAASRYHKPFTAWIIHTAMVRSVEAPAARPSTPMSFSSDQVRQGFALYEDHCVMCHGAPGMARAAWVNGMNPSPPYLMDTAHRFTAPELRFIISDGIKMTAMPAWKKTLTPEQISAVVALLEAFPATTGEQYRAMRRARNGHLP